MKCEFCGSSVKKTDKLVKVTDWFLDKDVAGGKLGETLTLGTDENKSVLAKTSVVPLAPFSAFPAQYSPCRFAD